MFQISVELSILHFWSNCSIPLAWICRIVLRCFSINLPSFSISFFVASSSTWKTLAQWDWSPDYKGADKAPALPPTQSPLSRPLGCTVKAYHRNFINYKTLPAAARSRDCHGKWGRTGRGAGASGSWNSPPTRGGASYYCLTFLSSNNTSYFDNTMSLAMHSSDRPSKSSNALSMKSPRDRKCIRSSFITDL